VTGCDDVRTSIGGYVLDALDPAEAEVVREHLARCRECADEHARLAGLPALLSLAEHIEDAPPLPAAVEERVLDAVARERRPHDAPRRPRQPRQPRRHRRLLAGSVAAAAALAAVLAIVLLGGADERPAARYQVALRPVAGAVGAGRVELASAPGGTTVHLWVRDLPPDPSVVYEVRCDAPDWSASAGTFRADTHGRAYVVLTTAARRGEYDSIRVVRRARSSTTDVLTGYLN
jgi:anti-sigma factor RsiW